MFDFENIRILLVEDDPVTAFAQRKILQNNHFQVIWAKNGEESIELFKMNQHDLDLILMDIDLGKGIDGTVAAERILQEKDIPVVFLSSHTEKEVIEKTDKITSYGFILKNSGEAILLSGIRMALKLYHSNLQKTKKEIELNNSKNYLRKVLNISTDGFMVVNSKGEIIDVNEAYCLTSGYLNDEIMKMNISDIDCIDTPEMIQKRMEQVRANGSLFFETQHQKNNGQRFPVEVSVIYISEPEELYVSFFRDISERKEHESIIREAEEKSRKKMSLAMKVAQMSYWTLDLETLNITWTKGFDDLFDKKDEDYLCHLDEFLILLIPEDFIKAKNLFLRAKNEKSSLDLICSIKKSDGKNSFIRLYGEYFQEATESFLFGIIQDISMIKEIENELLITQNKLKEAMNIASLVPWEYDVKSSIFTFSDDFYALYGTDVINENGYQMSATDYVQRFVYKEDVPFVVDIMTKANEQNDGRLHKLEHRILRRDGAVRYISVSYFTTFDKYGNQLKRYGANQDITESKQTEKDLESNLQRNNALMNAYPDVMFLFNDQYEIVDCHPREEDKRYYLQPHLFLGKNIKE
nr:PAS domain S-box protein [Candidatus Cloacimonadota bacterium]